MRLDSGHLYILRALRAAGGTRCTGAAAYWHPAHMDLLAVGYVRWRRINKTVGVQILTTEGRAALDSLAAQ